MAKFQVGDIVTRDGTDRHVVVEIDDYYPTMVVECIRAPERKWIEVGEREGNLIRRYTLVVAVHEWMALIGEYGSSD